jgi:hypothetical protein
MKPSKRQDMEHMRTGYALLKEALDEFLMVYRKDNVMAKAVRTLGAIEDTIYQYVTDNGRAM